ncbi:MAG: hypothetical protein DBY36_01655 [Clostridiales bacterium]|nr:MAG: hypothetical protein DBY36_01655 [Clostridiales bacterium]
MDAADVLNQSGKTDKREPVCSEVDCKRAFLVFYTLMMSAERRKSRGKPAAGQRLKTVFHGEQRGKKRAAAIPNADRMQSAKQPEP